MNRGKAQQRVEARTGPASDTTSKKQQVDAALARTGLDVRSDSRGEVDAAAFAEAVAKRFPKIMAKLAE